MQIKKTKIEEKVDFLLEFCEKNKELWINRENKEVYLNKIKDLQRRAKKEEELQNAVQCYESLRAKKSKNNLPEIYLNKLYNSQVGGIFAFTNKAIIECKEISQKYNIKAKIIKLIIAQYGSIDNFKKAYIDYVIGNGQIEEGKIIKSYIELLDGKLVEIFDLTSETLAFENLNYIELNKIPKYTILVNSQSLIGESERVLKLLSQDKEALLREYYGIGTERVKSSIKLAKKNNCTYQNILQKIERAQEEFLKRRKSLREIGIVEKTVEREKLLRYFEEKYSIFITGNKEIVSPQQENGEQREESLMLLEAIKEEHEQQQEKLAVTPLENLYLSSRAINILKRNRIYFVEDLQKKSFKEISELSGIGKKVYNEIVSAVKQNGEKVFNDEINVDKELQSAINGLMQAYEDLTKIVEECRRFNKTANERKYLKKRSIIANALKDFGVEIEEK